MLPILERPATHMEQTRPLQLQNVSVFYDGVQALEEISFAVEAGERVAIVGPNGAGKTTLFQVIAGIEEPSLGKISVYGHQPGGHVCIAYVPQRSKVDWSFPVSVTDVVMMGRVRKIGFFRWPSRQDWAFVRSALDQVGMSEYTERQISALSGGQQQRVFLAQAVAQGAEIVLLDEPLTGLDLPSQEAILTILDGFKRAGVTVLVATHDLNLAAENFDQVLLLNRRVVFYGPPAEALTTKTLSEAYGGHLHRLDHEGPLLLADTCCEGEEHAHD